jgi:hypothetical protein
MAAFYWNRGKTYGCSLLLAFPFVVILLLGFAAPAFCDSMSPPASSGAAYSEGTYTPAYAGDDGGDCATGTVSYGFYSKVGNTVHLDIWIVVSACAIAPTGSPYVSIPASLPLNTATGYYASVTFGLFLDYPLETGCTYPNASAEGANNKIYLECTKADGTRLTLSTDTAFSAIISMTYLTD